MRRRISVNYEASGRIKIAGCAGIVLQKNFFTLFPVGSKAYIKQQAKKGKIETIIIKRINKFPAYQQPSQRIIPEIMYTDTTNRVWAEYELTTQENAVDFSRIYWERIRQETRRVFEEGGCFPITPEGCQ